MELAYLRDLEYEDTLIKPSLQSWYKFRPETAVIYLEKINITDALAYLVVYEPELWAQRETDPDLVAQIALKYKRQYQLPLVNFKLGEFVRQLKTSLAVLNGFRKPRQPYVTTVNYHHLYEVVENIKIPTSDVIGTHADSARSLFTPYATLLRDRSNLAWTGNGSNDDRVMRDHSILAYRSILNKIDQCCQQFNLESLRLAALLLEMALLMADPEYYPHDETVDLRMNRAIAERGDDTDQDNVMRMLEYMKSHDLISSNEHSEALLCLSVGHRWMVYKHLIGKLPDDRSDND